MITEISGKEELLSAIDETVSQLLGLMSSLDEEKVNTPPYKDSWTAGQVFRHVAKSTNGLAKAMRRESNPAERYPGERIPELKKIFLDFSVKLKSPDFIIPEEGPYQKKFISEELIGSFGRLKENTNNANLTDIVNGLPFGQVTKLEMLHFVLYHTERHLHQMTKICEAVK